MVLKKGTTKNYCYFFLTKKFKGTNKVSDKEKMKVILHFAVTSNVHLGIQNEYNKHNQRVQSLHAPHMCTNIPSLSCPPSKKPKQNKKTNKKKHCIASENKKQNSGCNQ